MTISAAQVKALRERTGAGMMECKKALVETVGDIEAAIDLMRKSGQAKADKRAGKIAAEGRIVIRNDAETSRSVVVEVNSETDFVAKDESFAAFAELVAERALEATVGGVDELMQMSVEGKTLDELRTELIARIGENIGVRRLQTFQAEGQLGQYLHGLRIGVLVDVEDGDSGLARNLAMHIAASKPDYVSAEDVPEDIVARERSILVEQAASEGKPPEIVDKMVEGRLRKYFGEITLSGQAFVMDPDLTVGKLLDQAGARVLRFVRFEVGEGIEKQSENFADEVMAQVKQSG